ncbi:MAG: SH3 domain-containing protein [Clostridia bacterium]|nr:SH3 domain-containing protein [Clostridia bacterium]
MILLDKFLQCVRENADRVHEYEQGHDGSDGKCDCIGLIIGALKLAGLKWSGVHGSNWAARNAMGSLQYIPDATEIFVGEIVYKAKEPGESGYSLPDRYKDRPDRRDYYHVGVVTQITPLVITHCTSVEGGIQRDGKIGKWRWGGKMKDIDYEDEGRESRSHWAILSAENGKTVNLRKEANIKSAVIARVPVGTKVEVWQDAEDSQWTKAAYGGKTGYIKTEFLRPDEREGGPEDSVTVTRGMLENWADALEKIARDICENM